MCPQCGWQYDPKAFSKPDDDGRWFALVPPHDRPHEGGYPFGCEGSEQCPRNPLSDRRPLWNGEPSPANKEDRANGS